MTSKEYLYCNGCHVCDGELQEGWRVGCDDLVYLRGAEQAVSAKEEEVMENVMEAWRIMGEKTRFDLPTDILIKARDIFEHELERLTNNR